MIEYHDVSPIDRVDAEIALASDDPILISDALVRLAYHDADWRWVEHQCLQFLEASDASVQGVAATCLGHLARIHRTIDFDLVVPALEAMRKEGGVGGRAEDALDDIRSFAPRK